MLEEDFELEQMLGVGGLGIVWSARSANGNRVAIKITDMRGLYVDYAVLAIRHPNVVQTRQIIKGGDKVAYVMDLVTGETLEMVPSPMTPASVVRILDRLLDALEYLHEQGWCRLDIKPKNIVMRAPREPVIIDLGTAVKLRDLGQALDAMFIGTPAFAAPEAWVGKVDIRSDLYSLTMTMAYALGSPPKSEPLDTSFSPRLELDSLSISYDLLTVFKRGLSQDPDDRFPDPQAMRVALHDTPEWRDIS